MGQAAYAIPGYGSYLQYRDIKLAGKGSNTAGTSAIDKAKPSTFSDRGSFVPYLLGGARRIGSVILWVGDREIKNEGGGGGGGGGGGKGSRKKKTGGGPPPQQIYYESTWHGLCVGPATRLLRIWKNGRLVYDTALDSVSDPSGSSFQDSDGQTFTIYWGERTQAANTFLGDSSRVDVTSRWPNLCYVVWEDVKLGPEPRWPLIEYEIEVGVARSIEPISGYSLSNVCNTAADFGDGVGGYVDAGADPALNGGYGEWNPAHVIDQMLFEQWPQGLGLDDTLLEKLGLEYVGIQMETDLIFCSLMAAQGTTAMEVLEGLMADVGFVVGWEINYTDSGLAFTLIRDPSTYTPPTIQSELAAENELPEIETPQWGIPATKILYSFPDRDFNYSQMILSLDEDGSAAASVVEALDGGGNTILVSNSAGKAQKIPIASVTRFDVGNRVANRRSQENLAQATGYKLYATKSARLLTPGRAFFYEGLDELLRVKSITIDQYSGKVEIEAVIDFYGLEASDFAPSTAGRPAAAVVVAVADAAQKLVELPADLADGQTTVVALHIRDNTNIRFDYLHLSRDGTSYVSKVADPYVHTGGTLTQAIAIDSEWEISQGPQFTTLGPDISTVQDLSTADERWRFGAQLAVIGSEIFFLQKITGISGTTYRLDGLLRGRYNTAREAHAIGAKVFILSDQALSLLKDPLIQPQENLYVKAQPVANSALSLASVTALTKLPLYGLGERPEPISTLWVSAPAERVLAYESGDDIGVAWSWFAPQPVNYSGAGACNFGGPAGTTPVPGQFVLEIRTLGDVVKRTENLTSPSYTYTNANLVSDLGSEVGFKVVIRHQIGGFLSTDVEITVAKI